MARQGPSYALLHPETKCSPIYTLQIPKFLLERWASVNAEDVHLATIRVYTPPGGGKPRFILFLPPNRDPNSQESNGSATGNTPPPQLPNRPAFNFTTSYATSSAEPDCYELDMVNETVENQIVVAERPKDPSLSVHGANAPYNSRARTTILTGRIKHECNLRPSFSESYRKQMRERNLKYNTPVRHVKWIEDAGVSGGRGGINRLSSGVGVGSGGAFSDLIVSTFFSRIAHELTTIAQKTKPKHQKGVDRMARIPRNQLLDQLFTYFRNTPHWGLRPLREKTQQPEAYLKEVLSEIAFLHRSGEYNGMWELKENYKDENVRLVFVVSLSLGFNLAMATD